jgi:hypothetical protein
VICHLSDQLGDKRDLIEESQWIGFAQQFSIKELRYLTHEARVRWDAPEGRVDGDRRRPCEAHGAAGALARAEGEAPDMRLDGLRPPDRLGAGPLHRLLGRRWSNQPPQDDPAVCHFHHRCVHEGGYQVVRAGDRVEFIPPDRPVMIRRRWGERRWAA